MGGTITRLGVNDSPYLGTVLPAFNATGCPAEDACHNSRQDGMDECLHLVFVDADVFSFVAHVSSNTVADTVLAELSLDQL